MTFTEAALEVLKHEGRPMHSRDIAEQAVERGLLSHVGKTPVQTMSARLSAAVAKGGDSGEFARIRPGVFALRVWGGHAPGPVHNPAAQDYQKTRTETGPPRTKNKGAGEGVSVSSSVASVSQEREDEEPQGRRSPRRQPSREAPTESKGRGRLEAEDEEPQVRRSSRTSDSSDVLPASQEQGEVRDDADDSGSARPKRKRRRRKKRPDDTETVSDNSGMPPAHPMVDSAMAPPQRTVSAPRPTPPPPPLPPSPSPREEQQVSLRGFDPLLQIEDYLKRQQRPVSSEVLGGVLEYSPESARVFIEALLHADSRRLAREGLRPRFVLHRAGWVLSDRDVNSEMLAIEKQIAESKAKLALLAERQILRMLRSLSLDAFVRLMAVYMHKQGFDIIAPVSRGDTRAFHLTAADRRHNGCFRTAVVLRRDAAEYTLGDKSVVDLRGALHHYDAANGMIITTGQISPAAVEEAGVRNLPPIAVIDGETLARELVSCGIGVKKSHVSLVSFDDSLSND